MPSSTSKIPLPLGAVTSPSRSIGTPQEVPQQSRIPTSKGVRSPVADLPHRQQGREALAPNKDPLSLDQDKETFNHGQAREASHSIKLGKGSPSKNNFVEGGGTDNPQLVNKENLGGKKSRIPDIRNRCSPARDVAEPLKTSSASRIPMIGSKGTVPAPSRLPTSPSRIPTAPSSTGSFSTRKSMESLSGEDVDGGLLPSSTSPPLPPPSSSPSSATRSSSNSLSSSSSSPHKRGREQEVPHSKMRRTSPDGESVSPSKTRRPSPSKIPVAGAYIHGKASNSSSNEDFTTPKAAQKDPWNQDGVGLKPSPSTQSEMFATAPESEGEDWEGGRGAWEEEWGAGEGLAVCEGGEGFVPCEPLPRDLHTQQLVRGAAEEESEESDFKSKPPRLEKEDNHLVSKTAANHQTSPDRVPQLSWSLSREDTPSRPKDLEPLIPSGNPSSERRSSEDPLLERRPSMSSDSSSCSPAFRTSQSTSVLPDPISSSGDSNHRTTQSASRLPFLPLHNDGSTSSGSNDSDSSEGGGKRRKNFEAFVMTGDRMINLAKTPANADWKSKYQKPSSTAGSTAARGLDSAFVGADKPVATLATPEERPASPERKSQLQSGEATSPDFSTSSLISCSEHYNGESLLDNMSPQSPSSPDTPEWSLIANGESFHKDLPPSLLGSRGGQASDGDESLISSRDNRVIITIKPAGEQQVAVGSPPSPGTSSGGTLTPERPPPALSYGSSPPPASPPSLGQISSEEESDMESLHSYHPPVKVVDIPSAHRLAKRLYNLEGFHKSDISRHLSKNNDFSRAVAEEYCALFSFGGLSLDQALRLFLGQFCLTGETQDRERVLLHFSRRFLECNPRLKGDAFKSHDAVHTLTCAIMLLNTDLHNEALQQRKMTPEEFVENLAELNDGENFPEPVLRQVYSAIREQPIEWVQDNESPSPPPPTSPSTAAPTLPSEVSFTEQVGGINPFLSLPDPESAVDYKRGYVMRKACFDPNYKKTKMGKRSWKMFHLTLRDLVLFCHKDEKMASHPSSFESPQSAMRLHHSLATAASDYSKKQFVFRLRTCDRAEYLFQTSDQKELETWVETINTVVARYSSPQLPAPCSNNAKFQRPLYPSSRSSLSLAAQVQSHRNQVADLSCQLGEHVTSTPPKGAKSIIWNTWREKSDFLQGEVARYSAYVKVLENIVSRQGSSQLASSPLKVLAS